MIFKDITLTNFRQYSGVNNYKFSDSKDKNITVIIGDNGVGKTTFIQAFRYCFYGNFAGNKYLKLPKPEEILSFSLYKESDKVGKHTVSVEVKFEHNNVDYVMRRESAFRTSLGKAILEETSSKLLIATEYEGFKSIENDEADNEMNKLLPAGLSNIFMFDGERMEMVLGSKEFKDDLKSSILGILNLQKYEILIARLGDISRKRTSVIGRLYDRISTSSIEDKEMLSKYDKFMGVLSNFSSQLNICKEEENLIINRIDKYKAEQQDLDLHREKLSQLRNLEHHLENKERDEKDLVILINKEGKMLLSYSLLLKNKSKFENIIKNATGAENDFYQYLHVNTINEIISRRKCICGTSIIDGSFEQRTLESLKQTALPVSNAQYISYIQSDLFGKVSDYNKLMASYKNNKSKLDVIRGEIQSFDAKKKKIEQEISILERDSGEVFQDSIDSLFEKKETIAIQIKDLESKIDIGKREQTQMKYRVDKILESSESNNNLKSVINDLEDISKKLSIEKNRREEKARNVLSKFFNVELGVVMSGDYTTTIDADYNIKIINNSNGRDETEVLSTGQNVIISMSFIKSLIQTAKELSDEYSLNSNYGVIMDAALSNLDETHIRKVSEENLLKMDQLIFLSFKRQLRDEMFSSIEGNIGKAYSISKGENEIISKEIPIKELDKFIHMMEEYDE